MAFFVLIKVALFVAELVIRDCIRELRRRAAFLKNFPPISDAEFLALCDPGTDFQTALRVRRIVSDVLGVEYARVYPSSRFIEDLGAD